MHQRRYFLFALLLWLVAAVIGFAVEAGWLRGFDAAVLLALAIPTRAAGWPVPVLLLATTIGAAIVRLPVAAACAAAIGWAGDRRGAAMIAASTIGILIGNAGLKLIVGRARPELLPHLAVETSLSFPSGHASNAAAVYLAVGWVLVRDGARAAIVWPWMIALVATIGVSRVVLGVHWPTDVIAGWCVGAGWMLVCAGLCGERRP